MSGYIPLRFYIADDGSRHDTVRGWTERQAELAFARRLREELPGRVAPDVVRWLLRNYQLLPKSPAPR